uniref:glycerol-3-phosphate dehydrogenase 1-like protein isoform X2 n=1 Tax=Maylandia zebra TaxID=106582 RepID=UPI000D308AD4|nr:glycerol-3-phosphate dehydrogenase 1-like protein isoform X2 [Maylandia zebra]
MASPLKVCIVGSGNWGSAIARIIGDNARTLQHIATTVKMWVFEENINGRKLSDIINTEHENVAVPKLSDAAMGADLLVFVVTHQFIRTLCDEMVGCVSARARGITLIKGIYEGPEGLRLISDVIREKMEIDVSVLMGANIANEVAAEKFCESTIGTVGSSLSREAHTSLSPATSCTVSWVCPGSSSEHLTRDIFLPDARTVSTGSLLSCRNVENGLLFKELLTTPNFRITVVEDADTVELCGALKNIVAVSAGFCDGLQCGDNTKAAVIRLGLMEMITFAQLFSKNGVVSTSTFLESCGVADLIATCYGGCNRRAAEAFVRTGKSIEVLEKEIFNGQKLQGPATSAEVYRILQQKCLVNRFPLFTAVYQICFEKRPVQEMISCLQSHPEDM